MSPDYDLWPTTPTLRIDDVSTRTDFKRLDQFLGDFTSRFQNFQVLLAVSLGTIVSKDESDTERVFPPIFNAMSDHRVFFDLTDLQSPEWLQELTEKYNCSIGSHGLFHVDHRLLSKEVQEVSIRTSCSVLKSKLFIPPFNKYNSETVEIVRELNYKMAIWETGWRHLGYKSFDSNSGNYYFHMHDFSDTDLRSIFR